MLELQSPESVCRLLGGRVRVLRLRHNLSQQALADMCGASLSTVRRLESAGQGSLLLLVQVAQALQATQGFQTLLTAPSSSIAEAEAEAEAAARLPQRRRARQPRTAQRKDA